MKYKVGDVIKAKPSIQNCQCIGCTATPISPNSKALILNEAVGLTKLHFIDLNIVSEWTTDYVNKNFDLA